MVRPLSDAAAQAHARNGTRPGKDADGRIDGYGQTEDELRALREKICQSNAKIPYAAARARASEWAGRHWWARVQQVTQLIGD